jgi:hypothetical protein
MMRRLRIKWVWRTVILIAVIASLGGYAAWWMSWRVDPRFVGRWRCRDGAESVAISPETTRIEWVQKREITFDSDGTGLLDVWTNNPTGASHASRELDWWMCGNRLFVRPPADTLWHSARAAVDDLVYVVSGRRGRLPIEALEVIDQDEGQIRLRPLTGQWFVADPMVVLTRVEAP